MSGIICSSSCPPRQSPAPWNFKSHAIPSLHISLSQVHEAAYSKRPDVIRCLLTRTTPEHRHAMVHSRDPHTHNTPLMWACMAGCLTSAWLLLQARSDMSAKNSEGKNPLHLAVASGNVELVKKLIQPLRSLCGEGDSQGATPLHYASVSQFEMLGAFLGEGVSFLVEDSEGDNPLHWACRESALENVKAICLRESFLKDVPNHYGETPLHLACHYQEKEICSIFGVEKYTSPVTTVSSSSTENLLYNPYPSPSSKKDNISMFDNKMNSASVSNLWGLHPQVSQHC